MEPHEMPVAIRKLLDDLQVEVEALRRDHAAAVKNQTFELAASLRARSENLKQKYEGIMREWQVRR
jgi:hypothetical protein